ncbi:MAG: rRNA adenine N-6-methyltransferase family protein [Candidatus Pacebacteria bacterium]|nr:rRNA adenine N-6-methyltransferase family protein [Candidatus Paceibacterota bacterium]
MSNDWKVDEYIKTENTSNPFLQEYTKVELDYITNKIENSKEKTFIDVGAGYGRVIPKLSKIAKKVLAVEIDKQMLYKLKEKALQYQNVSVIEGDAQGLSSSLKDFNTDKPVVLCLQNSLGTPYGDSYRIISEMVKLARNNGELIISLFTQEGLKDCGISIYDSISGLTGKPDLEKTDFVNGNFVSKTGYKSHWWKPEEREKILKMVGGFLVAEIKGKCFYILHVKY